MPSIQEQLAAKRLERSAEPIKIPVPGWADDCLVVAYQPMDDWGATRGVALGETPAQEAEAAADALITHCTAVEARGDDGEWQTLPYKLGMSLTNELANAGVEHLRSAASDRQAVFLLFGGTGDVMTHYLTVKAQSIARGKGVNDELLGESPAT